MPSPLLDLPAELRICIYEYALIEPTTILIEVRQGRREDGTISKVLCPRQPAFTRSCKQLRDESLKIYYSRNTFDLQEMIGTTFSEVAEWLDCIGARNRLSMGKLVMNTSRSGLKSLFELSESLYQRMKPSRSGSKSLFELSASLYQRRKPELKWRWNDKPDAPDEKLLSADAHRGPRMVYFEILIEG